MRDAVGAPWWEGLDSLWDVALRHATLSPQAIALEFEGRRTSYAALAGSALAMRALLLDMGLKRGDRVAYLGKNSDDYFILLFGVAAAGCVLVPLNWRLAEDEWAQIVADCGAAQLFADPGFAQAAGSLAARCALPPPFLLDGFGWSAGGEPLIDAGDVVVQIYTSGTTGRPKGALLTHRNMLALRAPGYRAGLAWFPTATDTSLLAVPVAHVAGTAYALFGLYAGGRIVIMREFDPGAARALLGSAAITHALLVPAAMRQIVELPATSDAGTVTLRCLTYGASPIPEKLLRHCMAAFGCDFVQMYGMTEASGGVSALSPEDHRQGIAAPAHARLESAGRAMPGAEIAILDAAGSTLPPGMLGEIGVRSPSVMQGYWKRPDATAETITAQGWLRTGDIGRLDEDGYLFVLDRARDMIVSGGENVYPAEVENAIFGHPDVADVAVIGVPSAEWGEAVMAVVVARPSRNPQAHAIREWARARVAGFKVPKSVVFAESLPRNAAGKVLRRVLRAPFWQGHDRRIG